MRNSNGNQLGENVIFGGGGQFGRLFSHRLIEANINVRCIDLIGNEEQCITPRQDEASVVRLVKDADTVLLCIPENDILAELPSLARHMRRGSLLVDIASVKANVTSAAELALRDTGIEYLSIHPMFGPSINFAGGNMVFIGPVETPRARAFKQLVESWGVVSHTMTAKEHDDATRITQVACHAAVIAYASVAAFSGLELEVIRKVETPVSRALLAIGSRILSGDPGLYYAIQCNDGTPARESLVHQLNSMQADVASNDANAWDARLKKVAEFFGSHLESYAGLANEMLKARRS